MDLIYHITLINI